MAEGAAPAVSPRQDCLKIRGLPGLSVDATVIYTEGGDTYAPPNASAAINLCPKVMWHSKKRWFGGGSRFCSARRGTRSATALRAEGRKVKSLWTGTRWALAGLGTE